MIAKLEFTLPEETQEHLLAVHAPDLLGVIRDYLEWMRTQRKHGDLSEEAWRFSETAFERLYEELENYGVENLV